MSDSPAGSTAAKLRAPRWIWIALIASLAVNLLGIGVVAGAFWQVQYARATDGDALPGRLAQFADTLPKERGAEIRDTARAAQAAMSPLRQEARRARRESIRLFLSEPFDKEKFAAAHTRMIAAELEVRQAYLRTLTEIGGKLTIEERRQLMKWRKHYRSPGFRWREEQREDGPGMGGTPTKQ
jgi:uncharacterized membrane protein